MNRTNVRKAIQNFAAREILGQFQFVFIEQLEDWPRSRGSDGARVSNTALRFTAGREQRRQPKMTYRNETARVVEIGMVSPDTATQASNPLTRTVWPAPGAFVEGTSNGESKERIKQALRETHHE